MRIVVIGLGSMGKRRIRLLKEMYPEYMIIGVDSRDDRRNEAESLYKVMCYPTLSDIKIEADCAFVCTSPLSHAAIITECLKHGMHVFTELNLVTDMYDENIRIAKEQKRTLFLSSTFLYREEMKYVKSKVSSEKKWNYIYHIGQYLPDWHPWENYKSFFVGAEKTNGCREILAIELPWLLDAFGDVDRMQVVSDKMTDLDIEFDDNFMIHINHHNGNKGTLVVDVVSPAAVRKLEAYSENAYLTWNGTPDSLFEFNKNSKKLEEVILQEESEHKEGYSDFIVENAYKNEIREFFNVVLDGKEPLYGFEKDKTILKLIDSIGA